MLCRFAFSFLNYMGRELWDSRQIYTSKYKLAFSVCSCFWALELNLCKLRLMLISSFVIPGDGIPFDIVIIFSDCPSRWPDWQLGKRPLPEHGERLHRYIFHGFHSFCHLLPHLCIQSVSPRHVAALVNFLLPLDKVFGTDFIVLSMYIYYGICKLLAIIYLHVEEQLTSVLNKI